MEYAKASDRKEGRRTLRVLREDGSKDCGSSYRSQCKESRYKKPGSPLRALPPPLSSTDRGICADDLAPLLRGEGFRVVDIQTETENFFCEGILVHNCLIIDDPIKNMEQALSPTYRERAWEWWQSTAYTRLEKNGIAIILMTRWHEEDLVGKLLAAEDGAKWHNIKLPAIAEEDDALGRVPGEPLWPDKYDATELAAIKTQVGQLVWAGLYQQRPKPLAGNMVKEENFRFWSVMPDDLYRIVFSWDLTFTEKGTSFYVGNVWAISRAFPQRRYLLDQIRAQGDFVDQLNAIRELIRRWPDAEVLLLEEAANGHAAIATLKHEISHPVIIAIKPRGSKEARLSAVLPEFDSGNVFVPHPSLCNWVRGYIEELTTFPRGQNDDQVDTTTQVLQYYRNTLRNAEPIKLNLAIGRRTGIASL